MQKNPGITIIGLGPGDPALLTRQVWERLQNTPEIYLRTRKIPVVAGFPRELVVYSFDDLYQGEEDFKQANEQIVGRVLELGKRPQGVTYGVPGHPYVAETTTPEIVKRAHQMGIPVQVMGGMSFLESTFSALEMDPFSNLLAVDALELGGKHHPSFPPSLPVLISQISSREIAVEVKRVLKTVYPDHHPVRFVHSAGTSQQVVEDLKLDEIDRSQNIGQLSSIYLPPLSKDTAFEDFQDVVARLRAPDGCPWDREQTHDSLRPYLLEETYEALDALDAKDSVHMAEEFGDLLLQIVLHAQVASEAGEFTMEDIVQGINQKIVRRHPHVFGDVQLNGVRGVLVNWEKLKAEERKSNGEEKKGLLDGVSKVLPALSQAQQYQYRAARVGFDWKDIEGVKQKIQEEIEEVRAAETPEELEKELGDLLFALVNLVRWNKVDAESALRGSSQRFRARFSYMERRSKELGQDLSHMNMEELDMLWEEAKKKL